jgi:hypothetical protein
MYQRRISQWGLDKKNKASEMTIVNRKRMERLVVSKDSAFRIRGSPWNSMKQAIHAPDADQDPGFLDRFLNLPTPPNVEVMASPSAGSPSERWPNAEDESKSSSIDSMPSLSMGTSSLDAQEACTDDIQESIASTKFYPLTRVYANEPDLGKLPIIANKLHHRGLLLLRQAEIAMKNTVATAFESGIWTVDSEGDCTSVLSDTRSRKLPNEFRALCTNFAVLSKQGENQLAFRIRNQACDMLKRC